MKTQPMGIRFSTDEKKALEKAAFDDMRKISTMANKIIILWLQKNGYLK